MNLILPKTINGSESMFANKIKSGQKKHVITSNATFKEGNVVDIVVMDPEEMEDETFLPEVVATKTIKRIQDITIELEGGILKMSIDGRVTKVPHSIILLNEGMNVSEFVDYHFPDGSGSYERIIVHLDKVKY